MKDASYFDKSRQAWTFCWALEGDRCSGGGGWHSERTDGSIPSDHWSDQITRSHQPPQCSLEVITGGATDPDTSSCCGENWDFHNSFTWICHKAATWSYPIWIFTCNCYTPCVNISTQMPKFLQNQSVCRATFALCALYFALPPKSPGHHDHNASRPNMIDMNWSGRNWFETRRWKCDVCRLFYSFTDQMWEENVEMLCSDVRPTAFLTLTTLPCSVVELEKAEPTHFIQKPFIFKIWPPWSFPIIKDNFEIRTCLKPNFRNPGATVWKVLSQGSSS